MNPLVAEPSPTPATNRFGAVLFTGATLVRAGGVEQVALDLQLARARGAGLFVGLVASPRRPRGTVDSVAFMKRLDDLFGPFDVVGTCFHRVIDQPECSCVGLSSGTVRAAAAALRLPPSRCLVVGSRPSEVAAAADAGARGVVMPVAEAVDLAIESVLAPDRALEESLQALERAWRAS